MGNGTEELSRSSWEDALQSLSQEYQGGLVTIETPVAGFDDHYEVEKLPLAYIEYDDHDDAASVAVGGRDGRYPVVLRHVVVHPAKISVSKSGPDEVAVLEIAAAEGTNTVVTIHRRPELPA
jgi:hypothetical protein